MPPAVPRVARVCAACGAPFHRLPSQVRQRPARHCSPACRDADWAARFWGRVDRGDGDECWCWTGPVGPDGRARFFRQGRKEDAARVAYTLTRGAIPAGYEVCSRCDDPRCVRPDHQALVLARPDEVVLPHARLSRAMAATIRARYAAGGIRQRELATAYGLSPGQVSRLLRGEAWHTDTAAVPPARRATTDPRGRDTVPRLADVLRALVAAEGYATCRGLAERAGVSVPTVRRHWAALLAATGFVEGRRTVAPGRGARAATVALAAPGA
jgi:hypothetical protein